MTLLACRCGKAVRLGAFKMRVDRKHGISHYIVHQDGSRFTRDCQRNGEVGAGRDWICSTMKPYPKKDADKPWHQMMADWNAYVAIEVAA